MPLEVDRYPTSFGFKAARWEFHILKLIRLIPDNVPIDYVAKNDIDPTGNRNRDLRLECQTRYRYTKKILMADILIT